MTDVAATDWQHRLLTRISERGMSQRAVSLAAGLNPGAINSWMKEGKDPTLGSLLAVAEVLDVSLSYLLYGVVIDPDTERLLKLIQDDPRARQAVLTLLSR